MNFQFDGSSYATGRSPVQVEVRAWSGGVPAPPIYVNAHVLIVNELNSAFGAGWWPPAAAGQRDLLVSATSW